MKIAVASDHAGYEVKDRIAQRLAAAGHEIIDCGTNSAESVDYPRFACAAAEKVSEGVVEMGVLVCGTGIGMSIAANKLPRVRAALCYSRFTTEMARRHNDANIICVGARALDLDLCVELVELFIATPFEGGRHQRRLDLIGECEAGH